MDLLTVSDALSINSHQFPTHVDHPKFVMHLLTSLMLELGRFFDLVSVANFSDLSQSPSPAMCLAELTLFLRRFEAIGVWLTLLLAVCLLWRLFPQQRWLRLAGLPLLGLQTGLIYSSAVMRTEAFSIFLLLLGLVIFCCLCQSALKRRQCRTEIVAWLLGGFCFGLALLTKLQAIQAMPLFLCVCAFVYLRADPAGSGRVQAPVAPLPSRLARLSPALFGISFCIWAWLAWQAWQMPSLPGAAPFLIPLRTYLSGSMNFGQLLPHLKLQGFWILLLLSPCLGLALNFTGILRGPVLKRLSLLYPLFWTGLFSAFASPLLTHLFRGQGLGPGWQYLLQMAQSCIWTDANASTAASAGAFFPTLDYLLQTDTIYLLLALTALFIAGYHLMTLNEPAEKPGQRICLAIFFAGVLLLLFGCRALLRDTIWFKFLGSLSILILVHQTRQALASRLMDRMLLFLCVLFPLCSAWSLAHTLDQINWFYAKFTFNRYSALMDAVWTQPGTAYPQIMAAAYGEHINPPDDSDRDSLRQATVQARRVESIQRLVNQHFIGDKPPVRALGLAEPHLPVWQDGKDWARFKTVSPPLRGSLLINLGIFQNQAAGHHHQKMTAIWDTDLLLCIPEQDYQRLFQILPAERQAPLQISLGTRTLNYYPITLGIYSPDSSESLSQYPYFSAFQFDWFKPFSAPPFLLLREGNAWGPEYPNWPNMQSLLESNGQGLTPSH